MDIAINIIAIVVLAALSIFLFLTIAGNLRRAAFAGGSAEIQDRRLQAEIDRIMDQRRIERESNELSWNGFRKFQISRKVPATLPSRTALSVRLARAWIQPGPRSSAQTA